MSTPIHPEEYPREKLFNHGPQILSNYELIAIILNTGTKKENVLELSKRITSKYSLKKLMNQNMTKLTNELGIGKAKACKIIAIAELGRRLNIPEKYNPIITSAKEVANILIPKISHLEEEHLIAIYLNTRRRIIRIKTLFIGSLNESIINSREIFKIALEEGATGIILAHNHPSGEPIPSDADIESTKEIYEAGIIMNIPLIDHIIIGDKNYWSLKENGLIP